MRSTSELPSPSERRVPPELRCPANAARCGLVRTSWNRIKSPPQRALDPSRARIKRGARCADAGPNTRVPKNTPDASRTSRPWNLAFSRKARPEGFTIRCPVWPRTFGPVERHGPKTLPPGEPFRPKGLSDSRAHDPEGSERTTHARPKRVWLQSQNLPVAQIPVDNESSHSQFIHRLSTGPFARPHRPRALCLRSAPRCGPRPGQA